MTEFVSDQQIPFQPLLEEEDDPIFDTDVETHSMLGDIALVDLPEEIFQDDETDRYAHIRISEDIIADYLKRIGKVPLLNAAEEVELSKAIEAGLYAKHTLETDDTLDDALRSEFVQLVAEGNNAYYRMITSNLRLVVSVAKRYKSKGGGGLELSELIQEGNFGLQRAVEKFDYKKGFKFSTYATWWIRQSVTRAIADQARTIRLPVHIIEVVNRIRRTSEQLQNEGREATDEAIGRELDLPPQKVRELRMASRDPLSLQMEITDGGGKTPGSAQTLFADLIEDTNTPAPQEIVEQNDLQNAVLSGLKNTLRDRERLIIMYRYGFDGQPPATLDQIGKMLGVTRERVRQIESRALKKLQNNEILETLAATYNIKHN